jgi:prepilin-type N-terminal cleavage/methylation domain-containing protein
MKNICGFTLLELIVVLVLLAILFSAGYSAWPTQSVNVHSQAQQLVSDMNYLRMLASSTHSSVQLNLAATQYSTTETDGSTAILLPAHQTSNVVPLQSNITATYSNATIVFDYLGRPYSAVGSPLTSAATITLTADDGSYYTVTMNQETSYITITKGT